MKPAAITNQNQLYAVAARIGELKKMTGTEAAKEQEALMKLLVELESREVQSVESK